jgi:dephospho-CoA kinase
MLKIGITGGIGSGKTTVVRIFQVLGIPVYDADARAKQLMHEDTALKNALLTAFGNDIYTDGSLNRSKLAAIVFNDDAKLAQLNAIVHPVTIKDAANWMERQNAPYTLKEAALIFESGAQQGLDYVIGVFAPLALRLHRVMQRDGSTREQVQARMSKQISDSIKMRLCDFNIINDEQQPVIPQVLAIHERLLLLTNGSGSSGHG